MRAITRDFLGMRAFCESWGPQIGQIALKLGVSAEMQAVN